MTLQPVEQALSVFDAILTPHSLTNVQQLVIRGCWQGQTYSQIAEATGYDDDYIRDVGFQLWRRVSQMLGEKVSKSNFQVGYGATSRPKRNSILSWSAQCQLQQRDSLIGMLGAMTKLAP